MPSGDELICIFIEGIPYGYKNQNPVNSWNYQLTSKRPHGTPVSVKILAKRTKRIKEETIFSGFDVQEMGRPQGSLTLGTPPDPLPEIGDEVQVFILDDARRPQYRWDRGYRLSEKDS